MRVPCDHCGQKVSFSGIQRFRTCPWCGRRTVRSDSPTGETSAIVPHPTIQTPDNPLYNYTDVAPGVTDAYTSDAYQAPADTSSDSSSNDTLDFGGGGGFDGSGSGDSF